MMFRMKLSKCRLLLQIGRCCPPLAQALSKRRWKICAVVFVLLSVIVISTVVNFDDMAISDGDYVVSYGDYSGNSIVPITDTFLDPRLCYVQCSTGVPCEYWDELDFRVVVLTYDRPDRLQQCLDRLRTVDTLSDKMGVDIWIDRDKLGYIHNETLNVAKAFVRTWKRGRACVHMQNRQAHTSGQWVNTWRPTPDSNELALILDDDVMISAHAYRWMKAVHKRFGVRPDIAGYSLQMENIDTKTDVITLPDLSVIAKHTDSVFLYRLIPTYAFVPHPQFWREFHRWYHIHNHDKGMYPKVEQGLSFIRRTKHLSTWQQSLMYFSYVQNKFTLYPNFQLYSRRMDVRLSSRIYAPHKKRHPMERPSNFNLLQEWSASFESFPDSVARYDLQGRIVFNVSGGPAT